MSNARKFLRKYGQLPENINADASLESMLRQMNAGLCGSPESLQMIPSFITPSISPKKNVKNIVLDAGGTNFRSALAFFDDAGACKICDLRKNRMPGIDEPVTRGQFYGALAAYSRRLLETGGDIGFCFSYSVNMGADIDGTANAFTKEIKAPEVVGTKVGAETLAAIRAYDLRTRKIAVLNDTVATLLGGIAQTENAWDKFSTFIAYINGTGTNVCYIEKNKKIKKLPGLPNGQMIINAECGCFNGFSRGKFDIAIDGMSANAGAQQAEKMSSGRYIAKLADIAFATAAGDGLVGAYSGNLAIGSIRGPFDTSDLSAFAKDPSSPEAKKVADLFASDDDRKFARKTALLLIERAAKIGAVMCAGFIMQSGGGYIDGAPAAVIAEGTTFFKLHSFSEMFEYYLSGILRQRDMHAEIISGSDLTLVGAALASFV